MAEIILKTGRERSVLRRHPWIFSGAVNKINGSPEPGQTVDVFSSHGTFLAKAAINPNSNIIGRIWTWDENEQVDKSFFARRIENSIYSRSKLINSVHSNAMRLIYAESDGLPGLILDRYGDVFVVQFLTAGIEYWKDMISEIINKATDAKTLFERSDQDVRELEGLPLRKGFIFGEFTGELLKITENDITYLVDVVNGHKTGFYLDQRENRKTIQMIADGKRVLDCFSYTGGFTINALIGGASEVTLVDSSSTALSLAKQNFQENKLDISKVNFIEKDVFTYLRTLRDKDEKFDMIILDPPKFAPTASQAERAARGYKDINLLALKLLNPYGHLITFSCSGGISEEFFQKIVMEAAYDAEIDAVILKRLFQASDHPVALNFPEGAYLKGFIVQRRS